MPSDTEPVETPTVQLTGAQAGLLAADTLLAGRYRVIRFVARGGMGEVYEALDTELRTKLAVKTVRPELAGDPSIMERVRREVQLARSVTHAHVCRIFDIGHADVGGQRITFITMELLEGISLLARLRERGRAPADEALALAIDVIAGLDACHRAGVIHRDLKSENVLLVKRADREHAVLTDFGIARPEGTNAARTADADTLTREGSFIGSPAFMPPELIDGGRASVRSDVYSLGTVLWELVIGAWPLRGKETLEILRSLAAARQVVEPVPSDVDPTWAAVLRRCLDPVAESRFASAADVLDALAPGYVLPGAVRPTPVPGSLTAPTIPSGKDGSRTAATVAVTPPSTPIAAVPAGSKWRRRLAIAAIGCILAVVATWWLLQRGRPDRANVPATPSAVTSVRISDLEANLDRLEYGKARELATTLASTDPATGALFLARAEAGLGNWKAAVAAAQRARASNPALGRRIQLELEVIEKRATDDAAATLPLLEALYTTSDRDPRIGLLYAEGLIELGQTDEAGTVLDAIAQPDLSPALMAHLELVRAVRLYNIDGADRKEFASHGQAAITAAKQVQAPVLEGRARAIHGLALAYQGASDIALADTESAVTLLTAAGDRPGLAVALRMRGFIRAITGGDRTKSLDDLKQAIQASQEVGNELDLALAQNIYGGLLNDAGDSRDAADMWDAAAASAVRAHREDIADNRPRPNLAALLIYLGAFNSASKLLNELHARRGSDRTGREELNLASIDRAKGDLPGARSHVERVVKIIESTGNQQWRAAMYIESARNAFEAGDDKAFRSELAKAVAQFKASGEGDDDWEIVSVIGQDLLDRDPAAADKRLVAAVPHQQALIGKCLLTAMAARAELKAGNREAARATQRSYRSEPRYEQYSVCRLEARLLDAELAEEAAHMDVASRELDLLRESMRAEGFTLGRWRASLGVAELAIRRGDHALATTLARQVEKEARDAGYLRLAKAADVIARAK